MVTHFDRNEARLELVLGQIALISRRQLSNARRDGLLTGNESDESEFASRNSKRAKDCIQPLDYEHNVSNPLQRDDIVTFQFQERTSASCEDDCNCACHLRYRSWLKSPVLLKNLIGFFFLNYSSVWIFRPACTSRSCNSRSTRAFKATFCVPYWFLARAAHIGAKMNQYGDPSVGLTLQRRTPEFAVDSIYHISARGDIAGIELLLKRGEASPIDADDLNGRTALHVRILTPTHALEKHQVIAD